MGSTKGKLSLRAAVNSKCKECLYSPDEPGRWREQTERCTSPSCPLYAVRPRVSRARVPERTEKAVLEAVKARSGQGASQGRGKRERPGRARWPGLVPDLGEQEAAHA
jgi:hypothetical protein